MSETDQLQLPLVQAAQAQKHVTVNTAFERLDGIVQLRLESISQAVPPGVVRGAYAVPAGATGGWAGQDGRVALAANGGWEFVTPQAGWRGWLAGEEAPATFDGTEWVPGAVAPTASGAAVVIRSVEIDHPVGEGASSVTAAFIPEGAVVIGVTGRVLETLAGDATGFDLGIALESPGRYGTGYGVVAGSWLRGLTSSPLAYYADTALTMTAVGGSFAGGGAVRLAAHVIELTLPRG